MAVGWEHLRSVFSNWARCKAISLRHPTSWVCAQHQPEPLPGTGPMCTLRDNVMDQAFSCRVSLHTPPKVQAVVVWDVLVWEAHSHLSRRREGVLYVGSRDVDCAWEEEGQEVDRACRGSPGEDPTQLLAVVPCTLFAQGSSNSQWLDFFLFLRKSQHLPCLLSRREICLHLPRLCLRLRGDVLECVSCCTGCARMWGSREEACNTAGVSRIYTFSQAIMQILLGNSNPSALPASA